MLRPHKVVALFGKGAVLPAVLHLSSPLQKENLMKYPHLWLCHKKGGGQKPTLGSTYQSGSEGNDSRPPRAGVVAEIQEALKASG